MVLVVCDPADFADRDLVVLLQHSLDISAADADNLVYLSPDHLVDLQSRKERRTVLTLVALNLIHLPDFNLDDLPRQLWSLADFDAPAHLAVLPVFSLVDRT